MIFRETYSCHLEYFNLMWFNLKPSGLYLYPPLPPSPESQWRNWQGRLQRRSLAERTPFCLWGWLKELPAEGYWTPLAGWRNGAQLLKVWSPFMHLAKGVPFQVRRGAEVLQWGGETEFRSLRYGLFFLHSIKGFPLPWTVGNFQLLSEEAVW